MMRRYGMVLLALLLVCGAFACKSSDRASDTPGLLSQEAYANTVWSDGQGDVLTIGENGLASLRTQNETLWLSQNGATVSLQANLYRTAADTTPACVIGVGEARLLEDGTAIRFETTYDPHGVLAYEKTDGLRFEKLTSAPTQTDLLRQAPQQPGTTWEATAGTGELLLRMGQNLTMNGSLRLADKTERSCTMLFDGSAFALVDETDLSLLFYGYRTAQDDPGAARRALSELTLAPAYDPFGLCAAGPLTLKRQGGPGIADTGALLGDRYDTFEETLLAGGWEDFSMHLDNIDAALISSELAWLVGDTGTLLVDCGEDGSTGDGERYIAAYVLYDADGAVLEWSGFRPIDRAVAAAYTPETGTRFDLACGAPGMEVGEVDTMYFLDNGTVLLESEFDEPYFGAVSFRIVDFTEVG